MLSDIKRASGAYQANPEAQAQKESDHQMSSSNSTVKHTTRHHRVDEHFLALLEEDFGIDQYSLRKAFYGAPAAPKKQAIKVCEWAIRCADGDVDEAGKALRAWARNRGIGAYAAALVSAPALEWAGVA
jgi:hypothetical protein